MKMAVPFFLGGGGGGRGCQRIKNLGKSSTSSTTKDSQKLMILQFSNFVTPPPRVSGSAPVRHGGPLSEVLPTELTVYIFTHSNPETGPMTILPVITVQFLSSSIRSLFTISLLQSTTPGHSVLYIPYELMIIKMGSLNMSHTRLKIRCHTAGAVLDRCMTHGVTLITA